MSTYQSCPGCSAEFAEHGGPTHRYIEAHPGCWALYSEYLAVGTPDVGILESSRVSSVPSYNPDATPELGALVIDAYAAQHHGVPSPQATQSVAVHLLTLHGVLHEGADVDQALWIRTRALRERGVFHWLTPPSKTSTLSLRHLWPSAGIAPIPAEAYVQSVYDAWAALHIAQLQAWYDRFVTGPAAAATPQRRR